MFRKHRNIQEYRALTEQNTRLSGRIPAGLTVEQAMADGIPALRVLPLDADASKVVLHFHGGGYVTGSSASHLMMCVPMAQTLKMNLLLPDYRLAPEHPFPAALDDALKVFRWLLQQGVQAKDIIVSGDSAGGGLGLATVLALRDSGGPLPSAVVCISPWADLTQTGESHTANAKRDAVLTTAVLTEWALAYAGKDNIQNPLVSPVHADFHGFPPM
ncbi:MAG TPA: alpha/beta hydrolase, partial [Anaerolineales bacterium]|nr:alpha/beta hydrolase [Anaerolineales bacterium]